MPVCVAMDKSNVLPSVLLIFAVNICGKTHSKFQKKGVGNNKEKHYFCR